MESKLLTIILFGVIAGMVLSVPVIFMTDVFIGGLVVGALAGAVGHFVLRKKEEKVEG